MRTQAGRRASGASAVIAPDGRTMPADGTRPAAMVLLGIILGADGSRDRCRALHAEDLLHLGLDFEHQGVVVPQEELGVLAALADALVSIRVPGAGLLDDVGL